MKKFSVVGFFPDCVAHKAYQACEVEAQNFAAAARRALAEFRRREGIKGRRIRKIRLEIMFVEIVDTLVREDLTTDMTLAKETKGQEAP